MKRFSVFLNTLHVLGFLIILLFLAVLLNVFTLSSLYQINTELSDLQKNIRWQLSLAQVENAWLQQGLVLRHSLLDTQQLPSGEQMAAANQEWEIRIAELGTLTGDQATIEYLVSLPPSARSAFSEAVFHQDDVRRTVWLNQAFGTNQAIDSFLDDQSLQAGRHLQSNLAGIHALVANYNLIGLAGLGTLGLVGIWILYWASRLAQPLLTIRMAIAAGASGNYQQQMLEKMLNRPGPFGDLARATHQALTHLQSEEQNLVNEAETLQQKLLALQSSRKTSQEKNEGQV